MGDEGVVAGPSCIVSSTFISTSCSGGVGGWTVMIGVGTVIGLITGGATVGIETLDGILRFGLTVGLALGVGCAAVFLSIRSPVFGMTSLSSGRFLKGS